MFKKLFLRKKDTYVSGDPEAALYEQLFYFLTKQISVPKNAEQLIQLSRKTKGKTTEEIFQTYLLFEKYITTLEPEQKYTRDLLRETISDHFPDLINKEPFTILFLEETEKKYKIAIHFLYRFLALVAQQFGQGAGNFIEQQSVALAKLENREHKEDILKELQFYSFTIFNFVQTNYGESLAGKIFEKSFDLISTTYKELEVFPHLVTLIPIEIVRREHLGLFTQAQIEQAYLEKLAETENLNLALDQKIKEQEATQKLLFNNEIMLSSVISSALDAIVMTDNKGRIIQWNTAANEIFGYLPEEVKGMNVVGTIFPKDFLHKHNFDPARFLRNPDNPFLNKRIETVCCRKNGEIFPAELTITSFQNGQDYFFNGFIRDISIPKQKEAELIKTKEKAEQAAKAKSQFLSVMSHEIRTPLNAIIGFTELLLRNNPREDQQEDLKMLRFSGENLLNIINDILDFNKLESGKVQLSSVPFNLRELTQSLYQSFSYKAKEKNILFDIEYDEKMPFIVQGDSLRLSQILNNLISNAIKFTNEGLVKLKVVLEKGSDNILTTRFSVIDTGIGIANEKHQQIFDQFIQADSETTRLFGGTGLGLAISKKLAELMGSDICLESSPGKGSVFYFNVQFRQAGDQLNFNAPSKAEQSGISFQSKKILLAEDNSFNANIARRYINDWGAEMDVALDGQQALEFALRNKYDLILMDVQMPVLDGFACTQAIRKHLPHIPVIAITAAPINEVIDQIRESGMNDHVSKPFKPTELFLKLNKFLSNRENEN